MNFSSCLQTLPQQFESKRHGLLETVGAKFDALVDTPAVQTVALLITIGNPSAIITDLGLGKICQAPVPVAIIALLASHGHALIMTWRLLSSIVCACSQPYQALTGLSLSHSPAWHIKIST